jgi:integrase
MAGTTFKRCSCRKPGTGEPLGQACPRLRQAKHGSWYYQLRLGRKSLRRKGGFPTQAAAETALEELRQRLQVDDDEPSDTTVAEWLDFWIAEKSKRAGASAAGKKIRASTARSYQAHIDTFLKPHLGHLPLCKLRAAHISAMFDEIARNNSKAARTVGPASQQRIFGTLRSAFNSAVKRGKLPANPCAHVDLDPAPRPKALVWTDRRVQRWRQTDARPSPVMVWTPEQAGAFLDAAAKDRLYPLYHLMTFRGLRRGEAAGLRWQNVDLDTGLLAITTQVIQLGWATEEGEPKSGASERLVALDAGTVVVLRQWHADQAAELKMLGYLPVPTGRVFTREDGSPIHPAYITSHFEWLVRRAGLPPVRLHDLRHGAASLTYRATKDLKAVQTLLGHSQISITADTYTSLFEETEREAAEAAAALVPRIRVEPNEQGVPNVFPQSAEDDAKPKRRNTKGQVKRGAPPGTRTPNPRIKSPLLCQLS